MIRNNKLYFLLAALALVQMACGALVTTEPTRGLPNITPSETETQVAQGTQAVTKPVPSQTQRPVSTSTETTATETKSVTASVSPQPTPTPLDLLTARIEGDPDKIIGTIFWPDYGGAAAASLVFWVEARNPQVGNKDGAGISSVDFVITDSSGQTVYSHTAKTSPYCAFGVEKDVCDVFIFVDNGNQWPETNLPIQDGDFILTATVNADGGSQWSGTASFSIKLPG
jgi:hypothetical protein